MRTRLFAFFVLLSVLVTCAGCQGSQPPPGMQKSTAHPLPSIASMQVRAYPAQAVTSRVDSQTINVIVQDQLLQPVASAQITMAVQMPNGEKALYIVKDLTDAQGITHFTFKFSSQDVGLVQVNVKATHSGREARTKTSFQIWW